MKPWSEVYEDLRVLWREYWNQCYRAKNKFPHTLRLAKAIKDITNEIVLRDQRIRELEAELIAQRGPKQCPHCGPSCAYKDWPANRRKKS